MLLPTASVKLSCLLVTPPHHLFPALQRSWHCKKMKKRKKRKNKNKKNLIFFLSQALNEASTRHQWHNTGGKKEEWKKFFSSTSWTWRLSTYYNQWDMHVCVCASVWVCECNLNLFISGQAFQSVSHLFFYNPEFSKDLKRASTVIVCQKNP